MHRAALLFPILSLFAFVAEALCDPDVTIVSESPQDRLAQIRKTLQPVREAIRAMKDTSK